MQYLEGNDRDQMFMLSLEESVGKEAFVRVVDVFVDAIDFKEFSIFTPSNHNRNEVLNKATICTFRYPQEPGLGKFWGYCTDSR